MKKDYKIKDLICRACGKSVLKYKKYFWDGSRFCHVKNIIESAKFAKLKNVTNSDKLPLLICDCGNLIGLPTTDDENLIYFLLKDKSK